MKKLAIVVPCYNEEETIHPFLEACQAVERQMANQLTFNYYFVNDGSKDRTLEVLRQVSKQFENVHYLSFSRNFGKEAGLLAGLEAAQGDYVTVMDADLQDPPDLIPEMIESWKEGNLVNLAVRKGRDESKLKNFFADTYYKLVRKWVEPNYPKRGFDFFLIDKRVADELVEMQEKNSSIYLQLIWLGYTPTEIEYTRREREKGKSMWTYSKRINLFIDTFVVFSHKPIRFISGSGFFLSLSGLIFAIYFLIDKCTNDVLPGWTSLMVAMLLLSGFQMIMLGMLGEYMWRNLDESRNRPLYVIEKVFERNEYGNSSK